MSKTNAKINFSDLQGNKQETKEANYNDTAVTSLKSRFRILNDNLKVVTDDLQLHKTDFAKFRDSQCDLREIIEQRGDLLKESVETTIQRMDSEVQKSLSHQKAENSRLEQQINQLNSDKTVIGNQLLQLERRIDDISNQIGKMF